MKTVVFDSWQVKEKIGEGRNSEAFKLEKKINGKTELSALKYIRISKDSNQVKNLINLGVLNNKESINNFLNFLIKNVEKEISVGLNLTNCNNVVKIFEYYRDDHPLAEISNNTESSFSDINNYNYSNDDVIVDFYIRMEYVSDIKRLYVNNSIKANQVLSIGIDICNALEACQKSNIMHMDVKPDNIFKSNKMFKLGDFSNATSNNNIKLSKENINHYAAPELYYNDAVDFKADMYSLGIVLYLFLNKGVFPFEAETDYKTAFLKRINGDVILPINGIDERLMNVILKACAFRKEDRYNSFEEFRSELEKLKKVKLKVPININLSDFSLMKDVTVDIYSNSAKINFIASFINLKERFSIRSIIKTLVTLVFVFVLVSYLGGLLLSMRKCPEGKINDYGICKKGFYSCPYGINLDEDNKCSKVLEEQDARITQYCGEDFVLMNGVCTYKEMKAPEGDLACADGFNLVGTKCEKTVVSEAAVIYTCPDGYVLAGTKCITGYVSDAYVSYYYCEDANYTLNNANRTCSMRTTKTVNAISSYSCPVGSTLKGTTCESFSDATWSLWGWYCPQGGVLKDGKCYQTFPATTSGYTCKEGVSDGKGHCTVNSVSTVNAIAKYSCPDGYTTIGDKCTNSKSINATPKRMCAQDMTLANNNCYGKVTSDAAGIYKCPDGYVLGGTTCVREDIHEPEERFTCSRLYKYKDGKCYKYEYEKVIKNFSKK